MKDLSIKICPSCGKEYTGYPALSRKDNKTEICSQCGIEEAIVDFKNNNIKKFDELRNNEHYCIFEKRICEFANKQGRIFNCTAKSDEEMTCR